MKTVKIQMYNRRTFETEHDIRMSTKHVLSNEKCFLFIADFPSVLRTLESLFAFSVLFGM